MSTVISSARIHRLLRQHGFINYTSRLKHQSQYREHQTFEVYYRDSGVAINPSARHCYSIPYRRELAEQVRTALHEENISCRVDDNEVFIPYLQ